MAKCDGGGHGDAIARILTDVNKRYGDGALMRLGDAVHMEIEVISTGSILIDRTLGVGGLPRGRICEIFGPESSGKTTFCLSCIASTQRMGGTAAFIDVEHALDPTYARTVGVRLEDLLVSQPESGETALRIAESLLQSGAIDLVVVDSVAALASRAELEGQLGDPVVGAQARLMGQAMRRLTASAAKSRAVCLFTNQIRMKIGTAYGNPETTPGGNSLKFAASLRLDIRRIGQIKNGDGHVIGNRTKIKVVKNKVASPFTECEFDIIYSDGIGQWSSLVECGVSVGVLQQKGSWLYFGERSLGQGRQAAIDFLRGNASIAAEVEDAIRKGCAA